MAKTQRLEETAVMEFLGAGVNESTTVHHDDPLGSSTITVTLDKLRPYDRNPRQTKNPKYESIRDSIEADGLDHPPDVTRRDPKDQCYMIIGGGDTRLEALNELYAKHLALRDEAESDEKRLYHHNKAQSFFVLRCTYKPWKGEAHALVKGVSENTNRGEMKFIEKAFAADNLRKQYVEDDRELARVQGQYVNYEPLTLRDLAIRISSTGWTVDAARLSLYDFAVNTLFPVVPTALWEGAGEPLVKLLRRLDKSYSKFWSQTHIGSEDPQRILSLFFSTLSEFDGTTVDINGFTKALDDALGDLLNISPRSISAEVGVINSKTKSSGRNKSVEVDTETGDVDRKIITRLTKAKTNPKKQHNTETDTPVTAFELQKSITESAHYLAKEYDLAISPIALTKPSEGCDWFVIHPINKKELPCPGIHDDKAAVWWALFRLSRAYLELDSSLQVFEATFAEYMKANTQIIDIVLRLQHHEESLPEEAHRHIANIKRLTRLGTELNCREVSQIKNRNYS